MTVHFKCQSEYQKSYGVSRSRSCAPLAGLRSDQMGISREPSLQRRRRFGPVGAARSCSSLLCQPDVQLSPARALRTSPPAASRSRSAHRRDPAPEPEPLTRTNPGSPAEPETPAAPRPAADPGPDGQSAKPRPSQPDSQPQPGRPVTTGHLVQPGARPGGQRSEYHQQFSWKKPPPAASPILTAEQVFYSSSRSVPPFKKSPVPMETEYQRCFQGVGPPAGPHLRKHLAHQRVPLFHTHMINRRRREESPQKPRPEQDVPQRDVRLLLKATPPPSSPQVQRGHRNPAGGGATEGDAHQAKALRQQASSYRRRAWGTNFSRDHLSQLLSEHNALWEAPDTADSPSTPRLTFDLCPEPDSRGDSRVDESLDVASNSSRRSSSAGETRRADGKTLTAAAERLRDEDGEDGNTDEYVPTEMFQLRPSVQRTHLDLTTPATGGAILVGKLRITDDCSPFKQRSGSAVPTPTGTDAGVGTPIKRKEAWPESIPASPDHKPTPSPPSKPIRTKQAPPSPAAPPPFVPLQQHCIQGTLRHADFQHNGELGLRFREPPCSGGDCCSDEDDRLSVMTWRSAASCSMASSVLERAQKRRENFWVKR
ncbi:LOW QUALITY PROTEIN: nuclear protein MDM1 [Brachyistius frenatus]|uniref:LOW QUALITY PROTEIN: nuclear protein MDM1 n=1 Tax=Brachyistius frenatus TaxID=100188 RepID=UPI0037E7DE93